MRNTKRLKLFNGKIMDDFLERTYLEWINNFLTIERFASHYNLPEKTARAMIDRGREIHHIRYE